MADQIILMAARLAHVYGHDWNSLPQDERRAYVKCVLAIRDAATTKDKTP